MVASPIIVIERFGNHADERLADVISQEASLVIMKWFEVY